MRRGAQPAGAGAAARGTAQVGTAEKPLVAVYVVVMLGLAAQGCCSFNAQAGQGPELTQVRGGLAVTCGGAGRGSITIANSCNVTSVVVRQVLGVRNDRVLRTFSGSISGSLTHAQSGIAEPGCTTACAGAESSSCTSSRTTRPPCGYTAAPGTAAWRGYPTSTTWCVRRRDSGLLTASVRRFERGRRRMYTSVALCHA